MIDNIKFENKTLSIPAFIQPGTAENLVCVELGYGRTVVGDVGLDVGFNGNVLLAKNNSWISVLICLIALSSSNKIAISFHPL